MRSNLALHKMEALAASLRAAKDSGALPPEEFKRLHESFRMTDLKGQEWSIGLKTFEWHRQDGGGWVKEPPPARLLIETKVLRQIQKLPRVAAPLPGQRAAASTAKPAASSASASARRVAPRARPEPEPEPEPDPIDDSICGKCGATIEADDRFCGECGTPRRKSAKPAPRRPRPAAREDEEEDAFAPPPPRGRRPAHEEEDPYEEEPLPTAGAAPPPQPSVGVGVLKILWCCLMAAAIGLGFDWCMFESGGFTDHHLKELGIIFGAVTVVILALAGAFRLVSAGAGAVYNSAVLPLGFGAMMFTISVALIQNLSWVASLVDDVRGPLDMRLAMIAASALVAFITLGFVLLIQRTFLLPLLATLAALGVGGYALVLYFLQTQNDKFISDKPSPAVPAAIVEDDAKAITANDGPSGRFIVLTPGDEEAVVDDADGAQVEVVIPGNDSDGFQVIAIDKGVFEEAEKMGVPTPRPIGPNRNPQVITRPQN